MNSSDACSPGNSTTNTVTITYVSKYGVTKTEVFPANTFFNCEDYTVTTYAVDICGDPTNPNCWSDHAFGEANFQTVPWSLVFESTGANNFENGQINQDIIINDFWDGNSRATSNYPAFAYCHLLDESGHTDWYLPAHNELLAAWENLSSRSLFTSDIYLLSTEASNFNNWRLFTYSGIDMSVYTKTNYRTIRCMR